MQEDIERRSVSITIQAAKLTGRLLKAAVAAALRQMGQEKTTPKVGRNSLKRLTARSGGANTIEVSGRIRSFERIARKYQVRYSIVRDSGVSPPKWTVYFQTNQADALTAAFKEYTRKEMNRNNRPSLLNQLRRNVELVQHAVLDRVKNRAHGEPER